MNERSYENAQRLIKDGKCALDERDDWSEHQPTAKQEYDFIEEYGFDEYQRWYLGEGRRVRRGYEGTVQISVRRLREGPSMWCSGGRVARRPVQVSRRGGSRGAPARNAGRPEVVAARTPSRAAGLTLPADLPVL